MSIKSYLSELDSINNELERIKNLQKKLKDKKALIEENIQDWFIKNCQTSITYNGKVISVNNTTSSKRKKKAQKIEDINDILKKYGIHNNKKIVSELFDVNKGNKIQTTKLNFKKNK